MKPIDQLSGEELVDAYSRIGNGSEPKKDVHMQILSEGFRRWAKMRVSPAPALPFSVPFLVPEGTKAWYVDYAEYALEKATTSLVVFKEGKCDSISLSFPDTDEFDEFDGSALGTYVFFSEETARQALDEMQGLHEKQPYCIYEISAGRLEERKISDIPPAGCDCCAGDLALFHDEQTGNFAFIDSKGNLFISVNGQEIEFKVDYCPNCGRKF